MHVCIVFLISYWYFIVYCEEFLSIFIRVMPFFDSIKMALGRSLFCEYIEMQLNYLFWSDSIQWSYSTSLTFSSFSYFSSSDKGKKFFYA
jgi:hypothetical protein